MHQGTRPVIGAHTPDHDIAGAGFVRSIACDGGDQQRAVMAFEQRREALFTAAGAEDSTAATSSFSIQSRT